MSIGNAGTVSASEAALYTKLLYGFLLVALLTVPALLWIAAPYGRHARKGFGPQIGNTVGWLLMEAPAALLPILFVVLAGRYDAVTLTFLGLWELHYFHRAFVFPFRLRSDKRMPVFIPLSGLTFNLANGYLNWRYLSAMAPTYPTSWLLEPRFLGGVLLFLAGYAINQHADFLLIRLRAPGETGYKIPRGGLFGLVSCPNYLGEIIEWSGWALLTSSLPGLCFALWTAANLAPRAIQHHRYYREKFPDYPPERKALIPYIL